MKFIYKTVFVLGALAGTYTLGYNQGVNHAEVSTKEVHSFYQKSIQDIGNYLESEEFEKAKKASRDAIEKGRSNLEKIARGN